MASGVLVDPKCVESFKALKQDRAYRALVFKINDDMTQVLLEKTYSPADKDNSPADEWDEFKKDLPESDCRFIVYDFAFAHQGATKNRVLFIFWTPEYSKVRSKTIYASSREGVSAKLDGIQRQLQITDDDEMKYESIAKSLAAHTVKY